MTLEEIDKALDSWRDRLRRVDENLVELESESAAQMLSGRDGRPPPIEGVTRERVGPALESLQELFEQRARLNEVLDEARRLRATLSRLWLNDDTLAKIEELLRSKSIHNARVRSPLGARSLLSEAETETPLSPEELLASMLSTFNRARDAVTTVAAAWKRITAAQEEAGAAIAALEAHARVLGEEISPELRHERSELERLGTQVLLDPLGCLAELERGPLRRLAALRGRLEIIARERDRAHTDLERALRALQELRQGNVPARELFARCQRELDGVGASAPTDPGDIEALGPWLEKLRQTAAPGKWKTAGVGLSRWLEAARGYAANDSSARSWCEAALAKREELLGRLLARRAQAEAFAARGIAVDSAVEASAAEAEAMLRRTPTPLGEAERRVVAYEGWVIANARR